VHGDIKTLSAVGLAAAAEEPGTRVSAVQQLFRDVGTVVAAFVALAMIGFGTVFFGRRYVEVVADTTTHAFGRSFVVGLLGQLLLLPAFAMMIVGLVLTIVGILALPFAILAFVLGAVLAAVGGYLAVAHAVGETVTRRRMANGAFVRSPNSYGYIFSGLAGLLGLWAAAALFGWLGPVVLLLQIAATLVTWVAMTTGFGAVLLSRAGLRETFAGRYAGEMTDEYLWATPPATPTSGRMGGRQA
jgi:MFS family permease